MVITLVIEQRSLPWVALALLGFGCPPSHAVSGHRISEALLRPYLY